MKTISLLLAMCISLSLYAQKPPLKFGDVTTDELKMTIYPKDSSAEAVVLGDYGESKLEYNKSKESFQIVFERVRRVKILRKEGLDLANFNILLYRKNGDEEKVTGLKAVTYNLEGGKIIETKVKGESIIKEKYDEYHSFTKVTWPNVKVGSVIEITYRLTSDFVFNFQDWEFQSSIPTVWSEYRVYIPEYFSYEKYMQGYVPMQIAENSVGQGIITFNTSERTEGSITQTRFSQEKLEYVENRHRWAAKEVPAFKVEPFMTNSKDYVSKINFELSYTKFPNSPIKNYMGSWDDINKAYLESLGDVITGSNFLKKTTEEITAGKEAPEEKVASIFVYVRSNFLWDGTKRKYPGESLRKIFDDKKGSSAEINLLLASMLEKVDIKVNPVLVSTRDNGFVREATPVSSQFNYVVCAAQINDKIILLDATDKFLPIGVLPERCLNGNGFMVGEQGYRWVPLQPSTKARTNISVDLALLGDEGNLKGTLKIDRSGYHSVDARKSFVTKGKEEYLKDFVGSKTWELHKSEFSNEKDLQLPFKETYEVSVNEHATVAGAVYYISPFVMAKEESNPFKQEERKYPIDFGAPFDYVYFIKLTLPQGFVVEELPKSKVLALPGNAARYIFNVAQSGNSINITSNFSINKGVFSQDEYPNLREFYNQMVAKQAEQIVVKKQ
ncbi:MAG: transglutaminase domain-containing protein [Bacteroidota bacterium]|jgi:hypothetical protein|nr:DUF3857 and transglutaminase domain-containing protein [Cytophagales bacterium]